MAANTATHMVLYHRPPQSGHCPAPEGALDAGQQSAGTLNAGGQAGGHLPQRMQIEEGFHDVKSLLFGLGFGMHQSRQGKRIEILLLIAMLANVAMT